MSVNKTLATILGVVFLAIGILVGYLLLTRSLIAYGEISAIKSAQFPLSPQEIGYRLYPAIQFPKDRFIFIQYPIYLLLAVTSLFILHWLSTTVKSVLLNKKQQLFSLTLKLKVSNKGFYYSIVAFYWLSAVLGAALQGRFGNKYEIPILLPLLLLLAMLGKLLTNYFIDQFKKEEAKMTLLSDQFPVQL